MAAMQAESLEGLERADLPPGQARAIVRAIEIEIGGAKDTLATKQDIQLLQQDMTEMSRDLEVKIEQSARNNLTQMNTAIIAQTAVILGIIYALTHAGR